MFPRFSASTCNVILRRYSLLEVPRRRIHNAIAKAMSICVAFSNKVMDTRLPQPAGCGDKYDISAWCWGRRLGTFSQSGRSMIEMLGVLAIIAVLSVGGIAGYSKAMEKWKINKTVEDYSYLIQGLLENIDDIKKMNSDCSYQYSMVDVAYAKGLVPGTWSRLNALGNADLEDSLGNNIRPFIRCNSLVIDFYLGGRFTGDKIYQSKGFSSRLCEALIQNMAQPLHAAVNSIGFSDGSAWYGDGVCGAGKQCLQSVSLSEIHKKCSSGLVFFLLTF